MTASSPARGTSPLLQSPASVQLPLTGIFHFTVAIEFFPRSIERF
jgi:hypothetical protein